MNRRSFLGLLLGAGAVGRLLGRPPAGPEKNPTLQLFDHKYRIYHVLPQRSGRDMLFVSPAMKRDIDRLTVPMTFGGEGGGGSWMRELEKNVFSESAFHRLHRRMLEGDV